MPTADVLEIPAVVEDALREVSRIKTVVMEAVEEGVRSVVKAIKQGRDAAEDAIGDATHTVKRRPFQAVGVVFAAGIATGSLITWLVARRR